MLGSNAVATVLTFAPAPAPSDETTDPPVHQDAPAESSAPDILALRMAPVVTTLPGPTLPGRPRDPSTVQTEAGVRSSLHWGAWTMYADSAARIDVVDAPDPRLARVRLTSRGRLGLGADPRPALHLGVELTRTGDTGLAPTPVEHRAAIQLCWRFGF
jgi:hypothetical protein